MQGYVDPEHSATLDDWAFSLAFAQDQARYAFPVPPMQACKNIDCTNSSYALFCSEACRVPCEGDDTLDYYADGDGCLLGHIATADAQHQADQAAGGFAAMVCGVQPQPVAPAAVQALPEAPVSMNVHVQVQGRDVLMTIRGSEVDAVLQQLEALLQRFPVPQVPAQSRTSAPSTPVEPGVFRPNPLMRRTA